MIENYKTEQINAYSKKEALEKSEFNQVVHDCTLTWIKMGSPREGKALADFCTSQIEKWTNGAEGVACVITLTPGRENTRTYPCIINDVINKGGCRHFLKHIMAIDADGKVVLVSRDTKAEVRKVIREMYESGEIKSNLRAYYVQLVEEGEPLAFTAEYTTSKHCQMGDYLFFGVK